MKEKIYFDPFSSLLKTFPRTNTGQKEVIDFETHIIELVLY